jgi:hypothetical protein
VLLVTGKLDLRHPTAETDRRVTVWPDLVELMASS